MTDSSVQAIADLAREAPVIVKAPDYEASGTYYIRQPDGAYHLSVAVRPPLQPIILSLASLADRLLAEIKTDKGMVVLVDPIVHLGPSEVAVTGYDSITETRRRYALPLEHHPVYREVERLSDTQTFTQRDLLRFLRARLNGHVDDARVERFRVVNLRTDKDGKSLVQHGRHGVDRSMLQKVTEETGGALPAEIIVDVPVYDLVDLREHTYPVTILVDVVPTEDQVLFELTSVVTSIRKAVDDALADIATILERRLDDKAPVYAERVPR